MTLKAYVNASKPRVFEFGTNELENFESQRRLGSPSHWRLYFAFGEPSYALSDDILATFRSAVIKDTSKAVSILRELLARPHDQQGYFFQVFLERIFDRRQSLTDAEQVGVAKALAEVMDDVVESPRVQFGMSGPWGRAARLLGRAVSPHFPQVVKSSPSINWLADVMRDQGFAFGRTDPSRERVDRQWLTREDFEKSLSVLLDRFRELGLPSILKKPKPGEILFCWKQLGDSVELSSIISSNIDSDEVFLDLLDALRPWVDSSDKGLYRPLRPENIKFFLEPEDVKARLFNLTSSGEAPSEIRKRALRLANAWEDDD